MSLSQEPALSALKNNFVCGTKDITNEPYCGMSGVHDVFGNAVDTSNGAGPHNIQIFMLDPDGTVLNVLPGYWHSQDLVTEMGFAQQLQKVWENPSLSSSQKDAMFKQMHLAHITQHSTAMKRRSRMQGFDMDYEAENHPQGDTIRSPQVVAAAMAQGMKPPASAFKSTDEIMHERMAKHGFIAYEHFDVASFADYGKQKYDKNEDYRDARGRTDHEKAMYAPTLGQNRMEGKGPRWRNQQQQQESTTGWGNTGSKWGSGQ